MADEKTTALTSAARDEVTGKVKATTITLSFDADTAPASLSRKTP